MDSYYSQQELNALGLKYCGKGVRLSRNATLYGVEHISIGDHSRVDDFCVLSGAVTIGRYVHVAVYSALFGGNTGILIEDCATVSSRNCIYSENDDYSGEALSSGAPLELRKITSGLVRLAPCSILGSGCVVLPGVTLGEGTAVGAMSLVNRDLEPWAIFGGIPCRKLKDRKRDMKVLAKRLTGEGEGEKRYE